MNTNNNTTPVATLDSPQGDLSCKCGAPTQLWLGNCSDNSALCCDCYFAKFETVEDRRRLLLRFRPPTNDFN